jgi:predicted site-specific integrase-resolvase
MAKDNRSPQTSTAQEIPLTVQRVALYARVSTNNHGQNPEVQLGELRTYAGRRGWSVVKEYVDHVSGSKGNRSRGALAAVPGSESLDHSQGSLSREGTGVRAR